jgi:nucleotide-binding universal stress UspA family protein
MFKNILVATDGSDHANRAVDLAIDMAAKYGASLTVLSVTEGGTLTEDGKRLAAERGIDLNPVLDIPSLAAVAPESGAMVRNVEAILTTHRIQSGLAEAIMEEAKDRAAVANGVDIQGRTEFGDAAESILSVAEGKGVDLIVMGSRGLGALKNLLVGSVSQKVSHLAQCTCITVK